MTKPFTTDSVDVLIVGGGPAGMVMATLLARSGLKTLVIEKNADFEREFRGEILQPRFHRAMMNVGLFEHLKNHPHEDIPAGRFFYAGKSIGGLNLAELDPEVGPTWWMTQPNLLKALLEYGSQFPSFKILFDTKLIDIRGQRASVEENGKEKEILAKVIIGADGRSSQVRSLGNFELEKDKHDLDILWFEVDRPPGFDNFFGAFLSPKYNFLVLPKWPKSLQCGLAIRPGEYGRIRKGSIDDLRREIHRSHPLFDPFTKELKDFSQFTYLQGIIAFVKHWARDGLLLIGDAAHTCSPAGGIGVAIAAETACVAADVVIEAFRNNDFSQAQLTKCQLRREKEVHEVQAIQIRAGRLIGGTNPVVKRMAPWLFRLVNFLGIQRKLVSRLLVQRKPLPLEFITDATFDEEKSLESAG